MQPETMHIEARYPVSANVTADGWTTPGLAFEDYSRMTTQSRKQSGERRLPTPRWALNDPMLRELLVCLLEERAWVQTSTRRQMRKKLVTQGARMTAAINAIKARRESRKEILRKLGEEYVAAKEQGAQVYRIDKQIRRLEIAIEGLDTYLRYTTFDSGLAVVAAVPILYYRVGFDSVGVGAELALKPPHVRQLLWRMFETAKELAASNPLYMESVDEQNDQTNLRRRFNRPRPIKNLPPPPPGPVALYEYRQRPVQLVERKGELLVILNERGERLTVQASAVEVRYEQKETAQPV